MLDLASVAVKVWVVDHAHTERDPRDLGVIADEAGGLKEPTPVSELWRVTLGQRGAMKAQREGAELSVERLICEGSSLLRRQLTPQGAPLVGELTLSLTLSII